MKKINDNGIDFDNIEKVTKMDFKKHFEGKKKKTKDFN